MLERAGLLVLLCATARAVISDGESTQHQPALAMSCGKVTRHRDLNTGEWVMGSSDQDCITNKDEMLSYCRKVYPALTITNVLEESNTVRISSWCRVGSSPPCKGHSHNIRPVSCVVGKYAAEAIDVKEGCIFQHKINYSACYGPAHWESEAAKHCLSLKKTLSTHDMLTPCPDAVDQWKGVQFLCCTPPDLPKPKPNKGKGVPAVIPTNINVICLQPKLVGLCRALKPAWHYNTDSGQCEFFYYGGCGGNDNNFESKEECMNSCIRKQPTVDDPEDDLSFCGNAPDAGPCMAYFRNFYYDPTDGVCKSFVFGGCNGNKNNFPMKEDCEAKCKGYKKPVEMEPLISIPVMNLGPVMLDEDIEPNPEEEPTATTTTSATTTTTSSASSTPFYTDKTSIKDEHQVFANKMEEIKSEHQAQVNAILAKWDEDSANLSPQDRQRFDQLEQDLQQTITALENEYDGKMNALNDFHMERMDKIVDEERAKALEKFLDQLNADKPKFRHILTALEKYIAVERQDKTHIMEHYAMAMRDDFDKESVPDFRARIDSIETRVNKTRTVLMSYPDILRHIQDEVEEILATMPDSPDFEYDENEVYDDDEDEVLAKDDIIEIPDMQEEIDDGGIPDPSLCKLPPVAGDCRASIAMYYYDSEMDKCSVFTYGGCGGNDNRFTTMEDCQAACPGKPKAVDTCSLPSVVGFCRAALPRYYYDVASGMCKSFTYGGCGGNENRFATIEDCNSACSDKPIKSDSGSEEVVVDYFDISNEDLSDDSMPTMLYDDEEEIEDETKLDEDVDKQFNYYGDPIFDVQPQAIVEDNIKEASAVSDWAVWVGVGTGVLFILLVVAVIVMRRNQNRPPMKIVVDKPAQESEKELSSEEKQLLALQQNGYENPTFKFFEKRQMA